MEKETKSDVTRSRILSVGRELVLKKGFGGLGIKELLDSCAIPKGSFYYYFASKEAFGCALLQDYVDDYLNRFDDLIDEELSSKDKLFKFWATWLGNETTQTMATSCLVVKLAAEISDLSEDMRIVLDTGVEKLISRITRLLSEGEKDGSLYIQGSANILARNLYAQWLGAAILTKLSANNTSLHEAYADTENRLTKPI